MHTQVLMAQKMKPLLTQNNSLFLRSKQDVQAFNLCHVYSYEPPPPFFFFFSRRVIDVLLVACKTVERAIQAKGKYNKMSQEVVIDNNKVNLLLMLFFILFPQVIFSVTSAY